VLLIVALIIVGIIVSALSSCCVEVPYGHVAVIVDPLRGSISRPIRGPALVFRPPWAHVVIDELTYQTINMLSKSEGVSGEVLPPVTALTRDGSTLTIDITVVYRINPDTFDRLVQLFPALDYDERIIIPTVRQIVRDIVAKYTLMEAIENRDRLSKEITEAVFTKLTADPALAGLIRIEQVAVRNIMPPAEIIQKINEKLAAQQEALKAQFEKQAIVTRARAEAEKRIIEANATAMQQIIEARAEAMKRVIEANASALKQIIEANATRTAFRLLGKGQAEAILQLANVTGLPVDEAARIYVYLKYLEMLQQVLQSGRVTIIYVAAPAGNATMPLILPLPLQQLIPSSRLPSTASIQTQESAQTTRS